MAEQANKQKKYRVLNWHPAGAGIEGPCAINYLAGGKERSAHTGDVVDDLPQAAIGKPGQEDIRTFIVGVHIEEVDEELEALKELKAVVDDATVAASEANAGAVRLMKSLNDNAGAHFEEVD